jgi:hypothetical protein
VFRLNKTDEDGTTVFTVDGDLAIEYINIVEEFCDAAARQKASQSASFYGTSPPPTMQVGAFCAGWLRKVSKSRLQVFTRLI